VRRKHVLFVAMMAASSALGLVKGLVYAKVLDPTGFGYYGLVVLVMQYGLYLSSWGLLNALNNHLPIAFGRGRSDTVELLDRSLGALLVTSLITAAGYLAVVLVASPGNRDQTLALSFAAVMTVITTFTEFHVLVLRVQQRVVPMAGMYLLRACLAIALGAVAGALWGYRGVIGAETVTFVVVIVTTRALWLRDVRLARPDWTVARRLIRSGSPLMVSNMIVALSLTSDRIYVAAALPDQFGQYAFASLVVVGWSATVAMLEQSVAPRLLHDYGAGTSLREIRRRALRIAGGLGVAGVAGLGLLLLVQQPLADGFLSKYAPALEVMPALWVGGVLALLAFPGFILHAIRPGFSVIASGVAAVVAIGGGAVLAAGSPSLTDYAWLFVASQATALITITSAVAIETRRNRVSPDVFGKQP
jgi:O-antigen/teichoic acid export membrane protein